MTNVPDLEKLRDVLNDAAVLCGRLSQQVSAGDLPGETAGEVAATRNVVLAAQQCAALIARELEWYEARHGRPLPGQARGTYS